MHLSYAITKTYGLQHHPPTYLKKNFQKKLKKILQALDSANHFDILVLVSIVQVAR